MEIARPTYAWETNHSPHVNEGPQVAVRNGTINLVYSASGSWTNDYCLGLITADVTRDLLNPASWHKREEPTPGTGCIAGDHYFTTSPDGKEDWIVYHVAKYEDAGWSREVRTQRFTWNEDNTPSLGVPVDPNLPLPLPSSLCPQGSRPEHLGLQQLQCIVNSLQLMLGEMTDMLLKAVLHSLEGSIHQGLSL